MAGLALYEKHNVDSVLRSKEWIRGYYSPVDGSLVTEGTRNYDCLDWNYWSLPWYKPPFAEYVGNMASGQGTQIGYIFKCFPDAIDLNGNLEYIMIGGKNRSTTVVLPSEGFTLAYESNGQKVVEALDSVETMCIMLAFYDKDDNFIRSVYAHWNTASNSYDFTASYVQNWVSQGACIPAEGLSWTTSNKGQNDRINHVKIKTKDERYYSDNADATTRELFLLGGEYENEYDDLFNARKIRVSIGEMMPKFHYNNVGQKVFNDTSKEYTMLMREPDTVTVQEIINNGSSVYLGRDFYFKAYTSNDSPVPPDAEAVKQNEYIIVYDMCEPQNGFKSNGLAVLTPSRCEVTEELNGGYYVNLEHPYDEEGRYRYLVDWNIIKVRGQLFRIRRISNSFRGNSGKISVYAEHIFYDMSDEWIMQAGSYYTSVHTDIGIAFSRTARRTDPDVPQDGVTYSFGYSSDAEIDNEIAPYHWDFKKDLTLLDLIIGSDGFMSFTEKPSYLYRDNFYFSINYEMENMRKQAFDIRVGLNAKGITRNVDVSTFCSFFKAYDSLGNWFWWKWIATDGDFPHAIVRSEEFEHDKDDYSDHMKLLEKQATNFFFSHLTPEVVYVIDFEDIRYSNDYSGIDVDMRFKVGDKGRIIDERMGFEATYSERDAHEYEISKTVTDGITGKILQVQFGSARNFTHPRTYDYSIDAGSLKLTDTSARAAVRTALDEEIYTNTNEAVEVFVLGKLADYDTVEEVNSALNSGKTAAADVELIKTEILGINALVGEGIENDT